jgi:hypothetical protein
MASLNALSALQIDETDFNSKFASLSTGDIVGMKLVEDMTKVIYVCMYVCIFIYIYASLSTGDKVGMKLIEDMTNALCICMYVCVHIYICIFIYIRIYIGVF